MSARFKKWGRMLVTAICAVLVFGVVSSGLAWMFRWPEYPAMSARIQGAVGADLARAGITEWELNACSGSEVKGRAGDYDLPSNEGGCGLWNSDSWRFRVALGKDGTYHFFSPDVDVRSDDFEGTVEGTVQRTKSMLEDYQKAREKKAASAVNAERWASKG